MGERVDQAERVVQAAPNAVWRALTDPDALAQWLPPEGMTGSFERFDLRPGGGYRMTLRYRDAGEAPGKSGADRDVVEGRFAEIVPGERLVQLVDFESDDPAFAGTMRMTWAIAAQDEATCVTIRAQDVPSGISAEDHADGLASSLENLARLVERAP